jgi:hypothetical protein
MTSRRYCFKQTDLKRALTAARDVGLQPTSYSIDPLTGVISVSLSDARTGSNENSFDALLDNRE